MELSLSRSLLGQQIFCPSSVFVFDFKDRFFRPTRTSPWSPRGQGWPLHQPCGMLRLFFCLNGFEGDDVPTRSG